MFVCPQGLANPIVRLVDNHHVFLRLVDHSCNDLRVFFLLSEVGRILIGRLRVRLSVFCISTIRFLHFDYTLGAFRVVV